MSATTHVADTYPVGRIPAIVPVQATDLAEIFQALDAARAALHKLEIAVERMTDA